MISIITPCYNAEKYLERAIDSVLAQTYHDWEMLIVDDCSSDASADIINVYSRKDDRIRYFKTDNPSGSPTLPRNIGIENAKGRYIAFLDSDDLWLPCKLERQMAVLNGHKEAAVVYSDYEKITESGRRSGRVVASPEQVSYRQLLCGNVIGCLTGMYDVSKVGKVYMKPLGHEDYVMWLEILKKGFIGVGTCDVQALYRVRESSVSADKFKALRWQWNIYRNVENLALFKAISCFIVYAFKGLVKRMK